MRTYQEYVLVWGVVKNRTSPKLEAVLLPDDHMSNMKCKKQKVMGGTLHHSVNDL